MAAKAGDKEVMSSNKRQKTEEGEVVVMVYKQGMRVPKNVTKVIVDASVTEIPDGRHNQGVFSHCKNLKEVVFNDGLQKIGWSAFCGCSSLNVIKLPSTTIEIGLCAFTDCTKLSTIVLNEGLQKIGRSAFYECSSLSTIKLPSTVTVVGPCAFYECTNLREVVLNAGLQKIEEDAFGECRALEYVKFATISNRAKNLIDTGITEIEDEITIYQHFEWRGDELLVSSAAINDEHWGTIRRNLDQLLACISHYELKEATTIIELAMWKAKIEETGAATAEERSACRVAVHEVPGPAKDAILQYLEVDIDVDIDGNESDDSSQYSDSSGDSSQYSDSSSEDESDD